MATPKFSWTDGSGRLVLNLTQEMRDIGHHPGACDRSIELLRELPEIKSQMAELNPEHVKLFLREYGAWGERELNNHEDNLTRTLWLACADCVDNPEYYTE